MISKEALGLKIKTLRKSEKLTQEKLAEIIDISPRHIVSIEMGYIYPSLETILKISDALKISVKSLLCDEYYDRYDVIKEKLQDKIEVLSEQNLRTLYIIALNMV